MRLQKVSEWWSDQLSPDSSMICTDLPSRRGAWPWLPSERPLLRSSLWSISQVCHSELRRISHKIFFWADEFEEITEPEGEFTTKEMISNADVGIGCVMLFLSFFNISYNDVTFAAFGQSVSQIWEESLISYFIWFPSRYPSAEAGHEWDMGRTQFPDYCSRILGH